jgi:hypothetical protein
MPDKLATGEGMEHVVYFNQVKKMRSYAIDQLG